MSNTLLKHDTDTIKGDLSYEEWLPIPGTEDKVEVSDRGRVRDMPEEWWDSPKVRELGPLGPGYAGVGLTRWGVSARLYVHELVCEVFRGPRPEGHHIHHWDLDPTNNRATNLIYVTPKRHVELHPDNRRNSVLSADEVERIRGQAKAGWTTRALAKEWGMCESTIRNIRTGRAWKEK